MTKIEKVIQLIQFAKTLVTEEMRLSNLGFRMEIPISQLTSAENRFNEIETNLLADSVPANAFRNSGIGHMVTDSWPLRSILGDAVLAAEQAYPAL